MHHKLNTRKKMPNEEWEYIIRSFRQLGGIAENVELREGQFGRGVFTSNSERKSTIMTPKNVLIKRKNAELNEGKITIKPDPSTSKEAREFAEYYYNQLSWGKGGNSDSQSFLKQITSLSTPIKNALARHRFIDKRLLNYKDNMETLLERFIDERAFQFKGESVLVPMLELVNHSNYSPPFRVTQNGLETPPGNTKSPELLHKYSGKNSPMSLWRSYGFTAVSIVAYSIPFEIKINQSSILFRCFGQQEAAKDETNLRQANAHLVSIDSFPVGCQSPNLPLTHLISTLSHARINLDTAKSLMRFIQTLNINTREQILNDLQTQKELKEIELSKALKYEIELIKASLMATEAS